MNLTTIEKLKYVASVFIPATATFFGVVGMAVNFQYTTLVMTILSGLSVYIGTLVGIEPEEKIEKEESEEL